MRYRVSKDSKRIILWKLVSSELQGNLFSYFNTLLKEPLKNKIKKRLSEVFKRAYEEGIVTVDEYPKFDFHVENYDEEERIAHVNIIPLNKSAEEIVERINKIKGDNSES